jgi:hypothetical protein
VRSRGEPLADEADDAGLGAGDGAGDLDVVDVAERAALFLGLVVPVDAEQVAAVHVPQAYVLELILVFLGNLGRVAHLLVGRKDNALLLAALDVLLAGLLVNP